MKKLSFIIAICAFIPLCAIAQVNEPKKSEWNFGLGLTSGIVPTTDKTKTPIWLTFELGYTFWKHHQLTFDACWIGGGKKTKIGEAVWYTEDNSVIVVQIPYGVIPQYIKNTEPIYRKHSQSCSVFSYQYAMDIGENVSLHFGPSVGGYYINAFSKYKASSGRVGRPEIEKNEKRESSTIYGFGVGIAIKEDWQERFQRLPQHRSYRRSEC